MTKPLSKTEWALLHTVWVLEHHVPTWRNAIALRQHHARIDDIIKRWEEQRVERSRKEAA